MKANKLHIFLIAAFVLSSVISFAQQAPQYSTYMFNHFSVNPAFAGSKQTLYINTVQRYQWIGAKSDGTPRTQAINVQVPTKRHKMGWGVSLVNDQTGPRQAITCLGTYAYHLKLPKGKLAMGVRGGAYSYKQDFNIIDYKDKEDQYNGAGVIRKVVPTGDFGLYYYMRDFYTSLGINQIWGAKLTDAKTSADFSKLSPHIFLSSGKAFVFNDNMVFSPSVMLKYAKGAPVGIDINTNFRLLNTFWVGVSYRHKNSIVGLFQINLSEKLRFGYSYDYAINKTSAFGTVHEFYLGYDFNVFNSKIVSTRFL